MSFDIFATIIEWSFDIFATIIEWNFIMCKYIFATNGIKDDEICFTYSILKVNYFSTQPIMPVSPLVVLRMLAAFF